MRVKDEARVRGLEDKVDKLEWRVTFKGTEIDTLREHLFDYQLKLDLLLHHLGLEYDTSPSFKKKEEGQ